MPFNRFESALTIAGDVAGRLGLPVPASLTAGNDEIGTQLLYLLNEVGGKLQEESWQMFDKTWAFTLTPGVTEYAVPADFDSFVDDTAWNTTSRLPMLGPLNDQQWATLVARALGGTTFALIYKIEGDQLKLYNSPSAAQDISIAYRSRGWAYASGDPTDLKDRVNDDGDIIRYAPELVKSFLKLRLLEEKGFDTLAAKRDFDRELESARNRDKPATAVNLVSGAAASPLLNPGYNLPDTGYGS